MKNICVFIFIWLNTTNVFSQIKIMPLGNSITAGDEFLGYRDELYKKLEAAGYAYPSKFTPVGNDGAIENGLGGIPGLGEPIGSAWGSDIGSNGSGYTGKYTIKFEGHGGFQAGKTAQETGYTDHSLAQMIPVDIPRFKPDVAIVELGTNDILGGWSQHGPWPNGTDASWANDQRSIAAAENVMGCVNQIRSLHSKCFVFVTSVRYSSVSSDLIKKAVDDLIAKGATNVQYVDIYAAFGNGDMSSDGVHPARPGYLKMAQAIFDVLKPRMDIIANGQTNPVAVNSVSISPKTVSLEAGTSSQLTATILPNDATNTNVTWTSSNTAIATVNALGAVSGLTSGTATITVTTQDGFKTSTASITVTPSTGTKLTGTLIGTTGSYGNDPAVTSDKVFDGNLTTFFDALQPNGNWVGLDLGAAKVISKIKFAPRFTYGSRMTGGILQGSNTADFASPTTLFTIATAPTDNMLTSVASASSTAFRYVRYLSPDNGYGNIAELEFWTSSTQVNKAPTISITSPATNSSFNAPANITFQVSAADADGSIQKVEYFTGSTLIGTSTVSPFSVTWTNVPAANYYVYAKATDNEGATASSSGVSVTSVSGTNTSTYTEDFNDNLAQDWVGSSLLAISSQQLCTSPANQGAEEISVYNAKVFSSYTFKVKATPQWDNDFGVVFNYQDASNYYALVVDPAPKNATIKKVQAGIVTTLSSATYTGGGALVINTIELTNSGTNTSVILNGASIFNNVLTADFVSGKIGVYTYYNPVCFDDVQVISNGVITGLEDEKTETVLAYPNPFTSTIKLSKKQNWNLYNSNGQAVANGISDEIDAENLSSGLYVLKLSNGKFFKLTK